MSNLTDEQIKDAKRIFTEAYSLYQEEKYKESLAKYQEVLSLVEEADDIAGKVTLYTAIAQVHSKLGEVEIAKSEEFNTKAIEQLRKIDLKNVKALHQIISPIRDNLMMGDDDPDNITGHLAEMGDDDTDNN